MSVQKLTRGVRSLVRHNATLAILLAVGSLSLIASALTIYQATQRANEISVERQVAMIERSVSGIKRDIALAQEVVAVWDDPVVKLRETELNLDWFDENFGPWMHNTYGHDLTFILYSDGSPAYVAVSGKRAATAIYDDFLPAASDLLEALARRPEPGAPDPDLHLTSGVAVYEARLVLCEGRPVVISAMRIVPQDRNLRGSEGDPTLISVRYLDDGFADALAEANLIDGLRYSPEAARAPEVSVPLAPPGGELVGHFVWRPELPGSRILAAALPTTAAAYGLMLLVLGSFAAALSRSLALTRERMNELRESEARASRIALHDTLTGLPNRALLADRLGLALAHAKRTGERLALSVVDLDRFKRVNDTLGHHAGDLLIQETAQRLTSAVRGSDTVARIGGDEFVVLQTGIGTQEDLKASCERILAQLQAPYEILGQMLHVGASLGVALAPDAGLEPGDLMRKADIALYRAKDAGRGRWRLFAAEMDEDMADRSRLEDDLRVAMKTRQDLDVYYQPQHRADGTLVGFEALARWTHPTQGPISPEVFIPLAEEIGLIADLDAFVLARAARASRRWPDLFTAVNFSPARFRAPDAAEAIAEIVRSEGADPRMFELEVTEGLLIESFGAAETALSRLRADGFALVLDDFGTGYSSLGYLHRLRFDKIKIDKSFVSRLQRGPDARAIVNAIISLASALELATAAEGVETEEQRALLAGAGCNLMQGWLFAKAMPEDEAAALVTGSRRRQPARCAPQPLLAHPH